MSDLPNFIEPNKRNIHIVKWGYNMKPLIGILGRSEESKNMESRNTSLSLNTTQDSNNTIEQITQKLGIIQRYILDSTNPLDLKLLKPYLLRLNSTEILDNKSAKSLINLFANIHTHKQKEKSVSLKTRGT